MPRPAMPTMYCMKPGENFPYVLSDALLKKGYRPALKKEDGTFEFAEEPLVVVNPKKNMIPDPAPEITSKPPKIVGSPTEPIIFDDNDMEEEITKTEFMPEPEPQPEDAEQTIDLDNPFGYLPLDKPGVLEWAEKRHGVTLDGRRSIKYLREQCEALESNRADDGFGSDQSPQKGVSL